MLKIPQIMDECEDKLQDFRITYMFLILFDENENQKLNSNADVSSITLHCRWLASKIFVILLKSMVPWTKSLSAKDLASLLLQTPGRQNVHAR